jgi:hypothetical protein
VAGELAEFRSVVDRERSLVAVAAVHADALEAQLRVLRLRLGVLRSVIDRRSTPSSDRYPGDLQVSSGSIRRRIRSPMAPN